MRFYNIDINKQYSLKKLSNWVQKEKETCQEYTYILTDEFTEWFNKLFYLTKYHNCEFYHYEKEEIYKNAIVLYDVLCDYISFKEKNDEKKTDLSYSINSNIKVNDGIYNMVISNPEQYSPNSVIVGKIYIQALNDDAEYELTLNDLQNFVIEQINIRQNTSLMIINEAVKHLEENGFNSEDILNALQISYATVANKQIEEQNERRR